MGLALLVALAACGGGGGGGGQSASTQAPDSDDGTDQPYAPQGSADWPNFIYPQPGDPNVDVSQPIRWTAAQNARSYQLQIGTAPGASDVFDSGVITATSAAMPSLPKGKVIYARVRAILENWSDTLPAGHWPRGSYTSFRSDDSTPASTFTNVSAGQGPPMDAPLEWTPNPLALGYRVTVAPSDANPFSESAVNLGTMADSTNTDSGVIHTTHVYFYAPAGTAVTATLQTIYLDRTVSTTATFTSAGGVPTFAEQYAFARQLTAEVRLMADRDNQPFGATLLDSISGGYALSTAGCVEYKLTLLQLLNETQVGAQARALDIALQVNGYDTHTLVEMLDPASNRWLTLDPTFGLVTLRADGQPATAQEISDAARAQAWTQLSFDYLTDAGNLHALDYYIDYPLLYVNVHSSGGGPLLEAPPATLAAYFDQVPSPITSARVSYVMKCGAGLAQASADVDSAPQQLACDGPDNLTRVFTAETIDDGDADDVQVWRLRRFIF